MYDASASSWGTWSAADWVQHYTRPRAPSFGSAGVVGIFQRAFLGSHTLEDLIKLKETKEDQVAIVQSNFKLIGSKWAARDPAGHNDWLTDWTLFLQRWMVARAAAQTIIDWYWKTAPEARMSAFLPDLPPPHEFIEPDVQKAYDGMLAALSPSNKKGGFQDLSDRLEKASVLVGTKLQDMSSVRNLGRQPDRDLDVLRKTNWVVHPVDALHDEIFGQGGTQNSSLPLILIAAGAVGLVVAISK